jgi:hypothetical protein
VFNPIRLVESLQLRTAEQQDAQEYVCNLAANMEFLVTPAGSLNCLCLTSMLSSKNKVYPR